jgi:aspartate/methionine/tyrosine aminotransferase
VFSSRVDAELSSNRLARAVQELRDRGVPYVDLTESNPTKVGISYPDDLLDALAGPASRVYRPEPFGLVPAREAVCRELARRGTPAISERVILTASTSEAYSFLFKLLCNPDDSVLVPCPSYPLVDHLTRLDGVRAVSYPLVWDRRWALDLDFLERTADSRTRAVLVVSPNNPTGSVITAAEHERLALFCAARSLPIIGDEVFLDYPLTSAVPRSIVVDDRALTFSLGGLSKSAGLPQLKLGWIVVNGPAGDVAQALARLEVIADSYLSVSTAVQEALPNLLDHARLIRAQIQRRIGQNLARFREVAAEFPSCELLEPEGGWSAVVRVPAVRGEEELVLGLLHDQHVLVHPGFFFDFPREAYVVLSLLPPEDAFAEGISRLLEYSSA